MPFQSDEIPVKCKTRSVSAIFDRYTFLQKNRSAKGIEPGFLCGQLEIYRRVASLIPSLLKVGKQESE